MRHTLAKWLDFDAQKTEKLPKKVSHRSRTLTLVNSPVSIFEKWTSKMAESAVFPSKNVARGPRGAISWCS